MTPNIPNAMIPDSNFQMENTYNSYLIENSKFDKITNSLSGNKLLVVSLRVLY